MCRLFWAKRPHTLSQFLLQYSLHAFSRRLSSEAATNRISSATEPLKAQGRPLLDLSQSNPTTALASYPHAAIARAVGAINDFTYHPEPKGTRTARQAVAGYYRGRGIAVDPENILLTASTSEAYTHLFHLLCNPGDAVLFPTPSYPLFEHLAALSSVEVLPYRLAYDGNWHIDFADLRSKMSGRVKAIVAVNPNNPTGQLLKAHDVHMLRELTCKWGVPLISDEVFIDYALSGEGAVPCSVASEPDWPAFVLNGVSKIAGAPQMKLAWIVVNGSPAYRLQAVERLELIADTYLSVNAVSQAVLPDLFEIGREIRRDINAQISRNIETLQAALNDTPASIYHLESGWSAIVRLPATLDEEEFVLRLLNQDLVVAQPGYFFDLTGGTHIVVSLLTPPETFRLGLQAIRNQVLILR